MKLIDAFAAALESEFEINAVARGLTEEVPGQTALRSLPEAMLLNDQGADYTPVSGHPSVRGHELVRRLDLAHRRMKTLKQAIDNTTKLLVERMEENMPKGDQP